MSVASSVRTYASRGWNRKTVSNTNNIDSTKMVVNLISMRIVVCIASVLLWDDVFGRGVGEGGRSRRAYKGLVHHCYISY